MVFDDMVDEYDDEDEAIDAVSCPFVRSYKDGGVLNYNPNWSSDFVNMSEHYQTAF